MTHSGRNSDLKEIFSFSLVPNSVQRFLKEWKQSEDKIGIACSGGVDSVFAAHWLAEFFPECKARILILHFNHKTRGDENTHEKCWVEDFAQSIGLKFTSGEMPEPATPESKSEDLLRAHRLDFYDRVASSECLTAIVTGHHQEDKTETLIMRLSRGSSLEGLVAPKPTSEVLKHALLIRPLLNFSKRSIISWMKERGFPWCEDPSNQQSDYYRNYVRNKLLPEWEERCPQNLTENLKSSWEFLYEDAEALNIWAQSEVNTRLNINNQFYPIDSFADLPLAIQKRALIHWLNTNHPNIVLGSQLVKRMLSCNTDTQFSLDGSNECVVDESRQLRIEKWANHVLWDGLQFHLDEESKLFFPSGKMLSLRWLQLEDELYRKITSGACDQNTEAYVDLSKTNNPQQIRVSFWQPGMSYQPLGMKQNKKLQDCFTDKKIPQKVRHELPILSDANGRIMWVPGLQPNELSRVTKGSKSVLQLTYSST